jgi:hypothetical protein
MKKIITLLFVLSVCAINAQAFKGKGDVKGQVGAVFQSGANGIAASSDFGIGDNMSYGFVASYLLGAKQEFVTISEAGIPSIDKPNFIDRVDLKARFSANLGNVFKLDEKMDIYPGLDLGLRNFGAHIGFRYFFTSGFGVYAEGALPIAKYSNSSTNYFNNYNNQFVITAGASFNL